MRELISLKNICCFCILIFVLSGCESETVVDLFRKDLKVEVLFDDIGNLSVGSVVYMKNKNKTDQIGSVTEIEHTEKGQNTVHLNILYDYRKNIFSDTMFVLDKPFLFKGETRILAAAVVPGDASAMPLKSGAVVKGSTLADYNLALAKDGVSKIIDDFTVKTKKLIEVFRKDVESIDTDEISEKLQKAIDDIAEYSKEQKEKFEKETLPEIEKMIEDIMNKLEEMGNKDEREEIEKKYKELKNSVMI